jgi:hypothetical protein
MPAEFFARTMPLTEELGRAGDLIPHVDTHKRRSVLDYTTVSDFTVIGGLRYWRTEDEIVTPH